MEKTILIMNFKAYTWGKGKNLFEALENCPKTSGRDLKNCSVTLYLCAPDKVTMYDDGGVSYPHETTVINLTK